MLLLFWWSFSKYVGQRNTFLIILLKFPNAITIICIHRSLFLIIFHWTMIQGWIHADSAKVHKVYCTCEKYLQVAQIFPPQSCSIHLFVCFQNSAVIGGPATIIILFSSTATECLFSWLSYISSLSQNISDKIFLTDKPNT